MLRMPVDHEAFIDRVKELGPFEDRAHAEHAVLLTMQALRRILMADEAMWLGAELDEKLRGGLLAGADLGPDDIYSELAEREGVGPGMGAEHVQVVLRSLAEALPPPVIGRLRKHLPRWSRELEVPEAPAPVSAAAVLRAAEPTTPSHLAQGRPGGARPVSESAPGSRHPLSTSAPHSGHSHSVAQNEDPHGDTKLSGARGLTQEREGDSLANARRPVR